MLSKAPNRTSRPIFRKKYITRIPKKSPKLKVAERKYVADWIEAEVHRKDARVDLETYSMKVPKEVFCPDLKCTYSTGFMLTQLRQRHSSFENLSVLDIGTGSGVLGIHAAVHRASRVVAVDICDRALETASENAAKYNVTQILEVRKSDLFSGLAKWETFDVIVANLPLAEDAWPMLKERPKSLTERLFGSLTTHLKETGILYLAQASFGDPWGVDRLVQKLGFKTEIQSCTHFGVDWYVFCISRQEASRRNETRDVPAAARNATRRGSVSL